MASNPDIKSAAELGFVGSILLILIIIPYVGFALGLVGLIFILVALSRLARAYNNPSIFGNALKAVVLGVAGIVVAIIASLLILFLAHVGYAVTTVVTITNNINRTVIVHYPSVRPHLHLISILTPVGIVVVIYILMVLFGMYVRKSYAELAKSSNVDTFMEAGNWYWYGALTSIVLVGFILMIIADAYAIMGFDRLRK